MHWFYTGFHPTRTFGIFHCRLVAGACWQVILLSATMPADVLEVTKRFMREPVRILVKKEELTLEGIRQFYIEVEQEVRGVDPSNILMPHRTVF